MGWGVSCFSMCMFGNMTMNLRERLIATTAVYDLNMREGKSVRCSMYELPAACVSFC